MARVDVVREVRSGEIGDWQLCFHWCRYRMDDGTIQYGYRFVWRRREDGSIQAARGQARIPSIKEAQALMQAAVDAKWGDRDADEMEAAVRRLEAEGCEVDIASGHVGWPGQPITQKGKLSDQGNKDARLLREWSH